MTSSGEEPGRPAAPVEFMRNDFVAKCSGHEQELEGALQSGDCETANITVRETMAPVYDIPKTGDLINQIVAEASERLIAFAPSLAA